MCAVDSYTLVTDSREKMRVNLCCNGYVELKRWDFMVVLLWLAYAVFEAIVFTLIGNPQPTYVVILRPVLLLCASGFSVGYSIRDYTGGPELTLSKLKLFFLAIELGTSLYVLIYLAVVSFDGSCDDFAGDTQSLTCTFPWVISTVVLTGIHLFTLVLLYCRRTRNMMIVAQGGDILADMVVLTFYIEAVATNTDPANTVIFLVNLSIAVISMISGILLLFWHRFGSQAESDEELAVAGKESRATDCCGAACSCVKEFLS